MTKLPQPHITCPVEKLIWETFKEAGIKIIHESQNKTLTKDLDFVVPGWGVYIEVKQLHSPRIAAQMERDDNIIAIQGMKAARMFCAFLTGAYVA